MSEAKSEKSWCRASCHCGAVEVEAYVGGEELLRCNCSICSRMGWKLLFVDDEGFRLLKGEAFLQDYQFGKEHLHHPFCKRCGVHTHSFGEMPGTGTMHYSINTNCIVEPEACVAGRGIKEYDGASL